MTDRVLRMHPLLRMEGSRARCSAKTILLVKRPVLMTRYDQQRFTSFLTTLARTGFYFRFLLILGILVVARSQLDSMSNRLARARFMDFWSWGLDEVYDG